MKSETATPIDVLNTLKENIFKNLRAICVGIVQDVHYAQQTLDVIPTEQFVWYKDDSTKEVYDQPPMTNVPYMSLCGGTAGLTFPITKGDECLLFVCDYDYNSWYLTGENSIPEQRRRHDISDSIALVGLHNNTRLINPYSSDVKLFRNATSYMEIKQSVIDIITSSAVNITAPTTNISGDCNIGGNNTVSGNNEANTYSCQNNAGQTNSTTINGVQLGTTNGIVTLFDTTGQYGGGISTTVNVVTNVTKNADNTLNVSRVKLTFSNGILTDKTNI